MDEDKVLSRFRSEGGQRGLALELNEKAQVLNGMPPANVIRFSPAPDCVTNSKLPIMEKVKSGCFPPRYYLDKDASSRFAFESPVAKLLGDEINPLMKKKPNEWQLHAGKEVILADLLVQRWYNGCRGRIVKELPDKNRWKVKVQTLSNTTVCLAVSAKNMM